MFTGRKYITIGVKNEIPEDIQITMWQMIEKLRAKGVELDYLQVFKLKAATIDDHGFVEIIHTQEVPPYKTEKLAITNNPMNGKVFVISSLDEEGKEYSTMLLASEY